MTPIADVWQWQHQGACRGLDESIFFHPEGERGGRKRRREARAVSICLSCPVLQQCRSFALESREPYGVWGGLTEDERARLIGPRRSITA